LLPNSKVLVAGGLGNSFNVLASAELYDPTSGTWATTGTLADARYGHTATLLPNGKVLVAGGNNSSFANAELYDPASGTWTATGSLATARQFPTATLLPDGQVLVAGGVNNFNVLASVELYEPAAGTWAATGSLNTARDAHTAILLPNSKVIVVGGSNGGGASASVELYDIGLGFVRPDWQPQIATVTLMSGGSFTLTGSRFRGISQASGGNLQDSSTNYPLVQLRNLDNSQVAFLLVDPTAGWSDTSFTSTPVSNFPPGPGLVTVFTNGIPADSKFLTFESLLQLIGAASRKTHGGAGTFDINLPLSGEPGVECRSGGGNYTQVFTFDNNVVSGSAAVTGGTGNVSGSPVFSGHTMTVNLTGVTDVQRLTVTLTGVTDVFSQVLPSSPVSMNVLIGDVNGNKLVNATDVTLVKSQVGQAVTGSNFREDVNADGSLTSTDVALTKSHVGDGLP
jgi:Dockerin type I domain/Galactose oxidase, central domain